MHRKQQIQPIVEETLNEFWGALGKGLGSLALNAGIMAALSYGPEIVKYFSGPSKQEKEAEQEAKKRASATSGPGNVAAEINRIDPSDYLGSAERYRGRF